MRKAIRDQRKKLLPDFVKSASERISKKILSSPDFISANHIGYYLSQENEVDLSLFAQQAMLLEKKLYLPVFSKPYFLNFYRVTEKTVFQKNQFGILEPVSDEVLSLDQLDFIIVPVVAFDDNGNRVGRGLGCYDRYLEKATHCKKIGVAYAFQKVATLSAKKWDVKMDRIVTELDA